MSPRSQVGIDNYLDRRIKNRSYTDQVISGSIDFSCDSSYGAFFRATGVKEDLHGRKQIDDGLVDMDGDL
jgi:hypothetical protein